MDGLSTLGTTAVKELRRTNHRPHFSFGEPSSSNYFVWIFFFSTLDTIVNDLSRNKEKVDETNGESYGRRKKLTKMVSVPFPPWGGRSDDQRKVFLNFDPSHRIQNHCLKYNCFLLHNSKLLFWIWHNEFRMDFVSLSKWNMMQSFFLFQFQTNWYWNRVSKTETVWAILLSKLTNVFVKIAKCICSN